MIKILDIVSKVVLTSINIIVCLLILWLYGKFLFWLWPEEKWMNLWFMIVLAIDAALLISGIKPKGLTSWFKKE